MQLFDMAGTALLINHFLNKNNIYSKCFLDYKPAVDKFYDYYKVKPYTNFRTVLWESIKTATNFDIIHIHSVEKVVPIFKLMGKKTILHYHGSDINEAHRSSDPQRIFGRMMADFIIYNGEEMTDKLIGIKKHKTMYLPDFIDNELFIPTNSGVGSLIMISSNLDKKKSTQDINSDTQIYDYDQNGLIDYPKLPNYLNKFKTYYDNKITNYGIFCKEFSNVGLQALACGLDVYHRGEKYTGLPPDRTPKSYIKKLTDIYGMLLKL